MRPFDVAVIGAGVTGLASASALASRGLSVLIVDRHPQPGLETSTRNSGVIHAGIYYPPRTLKARLSIEGARLLYAFCETHGVPHLRCGKLVVSSTPQDTRTLERLHQGGLENGVEGLTLVDAAFVRRREPHVRAIAALYSPNTGVVDQQALIDALFREGASAGATFLPHAEMLGAEQSVDGIVIRTPRESISARQVVNAAGLHADEVSSLLGGETFTIYPCRGEYAELVPSKQSLVRALVYPVPETHGLGLHLIRSVHGTVRLGPTVRFQDRKDDYDADRLPVDAFVASARRLLSDVRPEDLRLSTSGIRPTLHPPEQSFADFLIRRDRVNPRIVHAAGIDSPGLTSCLAIGDLVSPLVMEAA